MATDGEYDEFKELTEGHLTAIKTAERLRNVFPVLVFALFMFWKWSTGSLAWGSDNYQPEDWTQFFILLLAMYLGFQVLHLRVLPFKGEFREFLRDEETKKFRKHVNKALGIIAQRVSG